MKKQTEALYVCRSRGKTKAMLEQLKNMPAVKVSCLEDSRKVKAFEILKSKITDIDFHYGGIMGNVIELKIGIDTCYLHFASDNKDFELLKEALRKD